jgi:NADH-quinone oxidoreductase subunit C
VVYEPVSLAQDFRTFEFMSPWEGADYVLPGDEKAVAPPPAPNVQPVVEPSTGKAPEVEGKSRGPSPATVKKTTDKPADTGAGKPADAKGAQKVAQGDKAARDKASQGLGQRVPTVTEIPEPGAPEPTEDRPARAPRKGKSPDTAAATQPKPRKSRARKPDGGAA